MSSLARMSRSEIIHGRVAMFLLASLVIIWTSIGGNIIR